MWTAVTKRLYTQGMPTKVSVAADLEREILTAEDFLDWLIPGKQADLIDGEINMHSPVSIRHADLLNFVDFLLRSYVEERGLGRLYREVVAVRLSSRNVFLPDLAFYRTERLHLLRESAIVGAPDLVVEVLSPRTADRDVGVKFAEYEQHGVDEYWILDPETLAHRFYAREGELLVEFAYQEESIGSKTIEGLTVERSWLDPTALPKVTDCLDAMRSEKPPR
jgi:Uma2 family endonuclease